MKNSDHEMTSKQAYEKPKLRVIELVAEEVMGVGCKTAASPALGASFCASGACSLPGS
ncbi:MAG: hypothetical protein HZB62_13865 [Nitrospirae bacterium]|nr:hypothetical protein [Nitrospirota bacterium]